MTPALTAAPMLSPVQVRQLIALLDQPELAETAAQLRRWFAATHTGAPESRDLFAALTGYWPSLPLELQRELVLLALEHRIDTMTRAEADANTQAQVAQRAARRGNLRLVASTTREET